MDKKFINLTSHDINVLTPKGIVTIPTSGKVARVSYDTPTIDTIDDIPIISLKYGEVVGLPEPQENTYYIVSAVVRNALKDTRPDVVTPHNIIRHNGVPYVCKAFRNNN